MLISHVTDDICFNEQAGDHRPDEVYGFTQQRGGMEFPAITFKDGSHVTVNQIKHLFEVCARALIKEADILPLTVPNVDTDSRYEMD